MTHITTLNSDRLTPQAIILRLEGIAIAALCTAAYGDSGAGWVLFAVLILAPDIFMLGYVFGKRIGALCYNVGHSYLTPLALAGAGALTGSDLPVLLALIWGAHIGLDRGIGYGLKYRSGFKDSHLTRV
jgi:hypothetical protein